MKARICDHARPERRPVRGFTLIEVVIAIGIFAGGIVTVLALMTPLNRAGGEVAATDRAAQLGPAVQVALERWRDGFAFKADATRLDQLYEALAQGGAEKFVGSRNGARVVPENQVGNRPDDDPPGLPLADRFYAIDVTPLAVPLPYTAGAGYLAVTVRVVWPYPTATSQPDEASVLLLNAALTP